MVPRMVTSWQPDAALVTEQQQNQMWSMKKNYGVKAGMWIVAQIMAKES